MMRPGNGICFFHPVLMKITRLLLLLILAGPMLLHSQERMPAPEEIPDEDPDTLDKDKTLVIFKDGRRLLGRMARRSGNLRKIVTDLTEVWYHKDLALSETPAPADPPVIYRQNEEGSDSRKELQPVVYNLTFGHWQQDFSLGFTCEDPKLGDIEDIFEVKRFSANMLYLDATTHRWPHAWEAPAACFQLFSRLPEVQSFDESLERARFLRQGNFFEQARTWLSNLTPEDDKQTALVAAETRRLDEAEKVSLQRQQLRHQGLSPRERPSLQEPLPPEHAKSLTQWWNDGADPSRVKALGSSLKTLEGLTGDRLAVALQHLDPAAKNITPGEAQERHWTWNGEDRHYSVWLPKDYDPQKLYATVVALHGQTGSDSQYLPTWLPAAQEHGMIIVSVEYIYGREWGYLFDQKDMEAVMGALADARWNFAVDPDRTFLIGHSQGGHTNFDISQSYVNEFTASAPYIGAPYYTTSQLVHQQNYPMYIVDGDSDGPAPKYCRKGIGILLKEDSPSVYVQYTKRGHEGFSEEFDDMWLFLAAQFRNRTPWPEKIEVHYARGCEGARQWLRIPDGLITTQKLSARSKGALLTLTGKWSKRKISLKVDKRLKGKSIEVLVPHWYTPDPKKPLEIKVNNKKTFSQVISGFNPTDMLREVARRKDRFTPVRQVLTVDVPK